MYSIMCLEPMRKIRKDIKIRYGKWELDGLFVSYGCVLSMGILKLKYVSTYLKKIIIFLFQYFLLLLR